ncbi:competence protein ComEA [Clostridium algifaecis]|uniref:Competence protein ComEA n=2 Tax=Clostridium algifaecis TaxID=1472040 RepID=A0ABS4KSK2_9CLOT|nr:competence protein ComEA [Clostridium algifaecis]
MNIINKITDYIIRKCKSNNKKIIGSIIILVIFMVFLIVGYFNSRPVSSKNSEDVFKQKSYDVENKSNNKNSGKSEGNITVYINGEVKKPGVYVLKNDSRIEDLVKTSGGFLDDADTYKLNLAKKLKDEDYISVDKKQNSGSNVPQNSSSGISQDGKVNINKASKEELKEIPGVGDVTAQKIIDYREKNGEFSSIEDIKKVGRIGDKTFEKIKDKIDVR